MGVSVEEIIEYWFSPEISKHWFASTTQLDAEIRNKYEPCWKAAASGDLEHWLTSPLGCLALVIVLDQFPLNMFRNRPESFSTEAKSIEIARYALEQEFDKDLQQPQKVFLYMPFMHSELLSDQDRSVELFTQAGLKENQRFAEHHRELIQRFGRFPHRNRILGRTSTPEEIAYLSSKKAFTG